jgi:2-polyprenyl-6-methoxyphenol hydroxylase-like FAD-dependent oxidoreductase
VHARLVVGADGLRSRVARELGAIARPARLRKLSLTTHVELSAPRGGFGEMHAAGSLCLGIAPVTADGALCNVTLVADAARHGRDVAQDARAFFIRSLAAFPQLRSRDIDPRELLASGPFDLPVRRIAFDGAVLVGDAAGYFDPFTGQGVFHALAAAERLAPVVAAALDARRGPVAAGALAPYVAAHRALTRGPRRVQRLVDAVVTRPALAELAIAAIARRSPIARALLAVTGDVRPASALLDPRLALSLLVPDSLRAEAA